MNGGQTVSNRVVSNYELLSALTEQMREAAVQGDWDRLINLEQQCSKHVETMKPADAEVVLDETSRQAKIQLIKKILSDDADIRSRTMDWMGQLQRTLQSNRQEQRLQHTYGGGA
jgi:flagellar protein FliT